MTRNKGCDGIYHQNSWEMRHILYIRSRLMLIGFFFFAKHYGIKHLDGLNLQIHWIKIALCNLMM